LPVASGATAGDAIALSPWDARSIPDGVYALSLVATDQAGLATESRVSVTLDAARRRALIRSSGYVTEPGSVIGGDGCQPHLVEAESAGDAGAAPMVAAWDGHRAG
jgi:hypothetical protein